MGSTTADVMKTIQRMSLQNYKKADDIGVVYDGSGFMASTQITSKRSPHVDIDLTAHADTPEKALKKLHRAIVDRYFLTTPNVLRKREFLRMFDSRNRNYSCSGNGHNAVEMNEYFLNAMVEHLNDIYRLKGYLMLNEAFDAFGFGRTTVGATFGWSSKAAGIGRVKIDVVRSSGFLDNAYYWRVYFYTDGPVHRYIDDHNK